MRLSTLFKFLDPDEQVLITLGDIYYCATPKEFMEVNPNTCKSIVKKIGVGGVRHHHYPMIKIKLSLGRGHKNANYDGETIFEAL